MKTNNGFILITLVSLFVLSFSAQATSLSDDLIALYTFNDGTANDSSGNGNDGTFIGGATTTAEGRDGSGLATSGGSHVEITDGFGTTDVGDFTVTAWTKFAGPFPPANRAYVVDLFTPSQGPSFWYDGPNILGTFISVDGSSEVHDTVGDPTDEWHHIAFSRQGSTLSRFYDGVLLGSFTYSSAALQLTTTSFIGTFAGVTSSHFFNGTIDEVGIWGRALDQTEITLLQNDVDITGAVPEPSTMLLGIMAGFLLFYRRF